MQMLLRRLRSDLPGLVGWSVMVAFTTLVYVGFYRVMITSGTLKDIAALIDNLPAVFQGFLGGGIGLDTFSGFVQALVFGGIPPLYFTIFAALGALSLTTRDIDSGNMEFLLSLPVTRRAILGSRGIALGLELLVLEGVLVLSAWGGGVAAGRSPDLAVFMLAGLAGWLLFAGLAGLFALVAVNIDDYQKGLFLLVGLGLVIFFSGSVLQSSGASAGASQGARGGLDWLKTINPYSWVDLREVFSSGHIPLGGAVALLGFGAVTWAGAILSFSRKQIAG